jgi:hypothetical protein
MNLDEISYAEIKNCLEDAKQGLLSPYWQGYAKRELDSLRDNTGALPPDAEILAKQLQSILASTPQISNHESLKREVVAQGNELIYDFHGSNPDAFATIICVPEKNAYTASTSLPNSPDESVCAEAQAMRKDLLNWLEERRTSQGRTTAHSQFPTSAEPEYHESPEAAAQAILTILDSM